MTRAPDIPESLSLAAQTVLLTTSPWEKADKTRAFVAAWRSGAIKTIGLPSALPDRPARLEKPELRAPRDMPRRRKAGTLANKIALLHALAHIELNAIDLSWDIMARFAHLAEETVAMKNPANPQTQFSLPNGFFDDWAKVADDEAKHFLMLSARLRDLGAGYGDLPAHDGLWESAVRTADDFAARLAIVPMVLEARGLDVTPAMADNMRAQGDEETAALFQVIHDDEITHVRAGTVWFESWCAFHGKDIEETFQQLVRSYFTGTLKRPFNHPSRFEAGMLQDWYEPLADELDEASN